MTQLDKLLAFVAVVLALEQSAGRPLVKKRRARADTMCACANSPTARTKWFR